MRANIILCAFAVTLAGCSLSGYDASSHFSCKAPDGVLCESMSGIYSNAEQNNLPSQKVTHSGARREAASTTPKTEGVMTQPIYSGTPIRTAPEVLRVWFAPWEDSDGDLHDQSYVYLTLNTGRWLIEHNRRRIQDIYAPVRGPSHLETSVPANSSQVSQSSTVQTPVANSGNRSFENIGVNQNAMDAQNAALQGIRLPQGNVIGTPTEQ